jgi:hypothetical protein
VCVKKIYDIYACWLYYASLIVSESHFRAQMLFVYFGFFFFPIARLELIVVVLVLF